MKNLLVWLELEVPCCELQHNFNINRKHKGIRLAQESSRSQRIYNYKERTNGELDMSYCFFLPVCRLYWSMEFLAFYVLRKIFLSGCRPVANAFVLSHVFGLLLRFLKKI